jgi:hypothetical protein
MYLGTNEALKLKDFLGVSHISNPTNAVEWVIRDSFLPIVTAGQQPVFLDPARTLGIMVSDRFEPLRTVYLPLEARGKINARDPMNARILSTHFSSRRLLMEVEADGPAMVVVAQAFYHPWRAYVDGKRTPLWQANYAFQALEVPSGRHNVTLAYEDRLFWWGAVVSLGFLLVCIEGWIWFRTKQ